MSKFNHLFRAATLIILTTSVSGCWLFPNHRKTVDLPFEGNASNGRIVILKAEDRIAYGKEFGAFCSEPSPDAISALASSIGASALIDPEQKKPNSP